jgi:hypothetical protein
MAAVLLGLGWLFFLVVPPLLVLFFRPTWFGYTFGAFTQYLSGIVFGVVGRAYGPTYDGENFGLGVAILFGLPFAFAYCSPFLVFRIVRERRRSRGAASAESAGDACANPPKTEATVERRKP